MATTVLFPDVKRQGLEADHLPQSTTEVKNMWSYEYICIPPYVFLAWFLVN
jgi:hypothetical protein